MSTGPRQRDQTAGVRRRDTRLARADLVAIVLGALVTGLELLVLGRLTAPVVALDSIAAALVPLAIVAMVVNVAPGRPRRGADEGDAGGGPDGPGSGGGGGRRGGDGWKPLPPTSGPDVDWGRFEREFRAYAERVAGILEPGRV